jgi:hypothetical protein
VPQTLHFARNSTGEPRDGILELVQVERFNYHNCDDVVHGLFDVLLELPHNAPPG